MSETYYVAKPLRIQSRQFNTGDVVGSGNAKAGEFKPAEGLEGIVGRGHVMARLMDGRITTEKPSQPTAHPKGTGHGKSSRKQQKPTAQPKADAEQGE